MGRRRSEAYENCYNLDLYGRLKEFCSKINLPFYGLHSFRHFTAAALIPAGEPVIISIQSRALCSFCAFERIAQFG